MNEKDIAIKNKAVYAVDIVKIVSGAILSLLLIIFVLIFRKSSAFTRGFYSLFDFTLLFLLLSVGLFVRGVKSLRNHRNMPDVMLTVSKNSFIVLSNEIAFGSIKSLKGKHEFRRTGTIIIETNVEIYKLYGVPEYARAINAMSDIIAKNRQDSV